MPQIVGETAGKIGLKLKKKRNIQVKGREVFQIALIMIKSSILIFLVYKYLFHT